MSGRTTLFAGSLLGIAIAAVLFPVDAAGAAKPRPASRRTGDRR